MKERIHLGFDIRIFANDIEADFQIRLRGAAHLAADFVTLFLFDAREIFLKRSVQCDARRGTIDFLVIGPAALLGFCFEGGERGRRIRQVIPIDRRPIVGAAFPRPVD